MSQQKNVLLVTNFTTDSEIALIKEAFNQAKEQRLEIKLNLVHIISNLPTCYFNIPSMVLLAERYYNEATSILTSIGKALSIDKKSQWLINGKIKSEVFRLANRLGTHYILASSHVMQDLHKSFLFARKDHRATPIYSVNQLIR